MIEQTRGMASMSSLTKGDGGGKESEVAAQRKEGKREVEVI